MCWVGGGRTGTLGSDIDIIYDICMDGMAFGGALLEGRYFTLNLLLKELNIQHGMIILRVDGSWFL